MDVTIETTDLIQKQGKNGAYYQQLAFVHIPNPDGSPQRYPRQIKIFAPRDNQNKPVAYPVGEYVMQETSFTVDNYENLVLGFLNLKKKSK